jgi:hypothetical protein
MQSDQRMTQTCLKFSQNIQNGKRVVYKATEMNENLQYFDLYIYARLLSV